MPPSCRRPAACSFAPEPALLPAFLLVVSASLLHGLVSLLRRAQIIWESYSASQSLRGCDGTVKWNDVTEKTAGVGLGGRVGRNCRGRAQLAGSATRGAVGRQGDYKRVGQRPRVGVFRKTSNGGTDGVLTFQDSRCRPRVQGRRGGNVPCTFPGFSTEKVHATGKRLPHWLGGEAPDPVLKEPLREEQVPPQRVPGVAVAYGRRLPVQVQRLGCFRSFGKAPCGRIKEQTLTVKVRILSVELSIWKHDGR
jgi:hypothetical protein